MKKQSTQHPIWSRRKFSISTAAIISGLAGCSSTDDTTNENGGAQNTGGNGGGQSGDDVDLATVKREAQEYSYQDLMRNSGQYKGEFVHFPQGQIEQVLGNEQDGFQFRVYVTQDEFSWDNDILVRWNGERYLEDDIVEIWGQFQGLVTYETVMGDERTIPDVTGHGIKLLQQPTATPQPTAELLEDEWTVIEEYDYSEDTYGVVGTVKNTSNRSIDIEVDVRFLDQSGTQIDEGSDYASGVPPNGNSRFEVPYYGDADDVASYDISVEASEHY